MANTKRSRVPAAVTARSLVAWHRHTKAEPAPTGIEWKPYAQIGKAYSGYGVPKLTNEERDRLAKAFLNMADGREERVLAIYGVDSMVCDAIMKYRQNLAHQGQRVPNRERKTRIKKVARAGRAYLEALAELDLGSWDYLTNQIGLCLGGSIGPEWTRSEKPSSYSEFIPFGDNEPGKTRRDALHRLTIVGEGVESVVVTAESAARAVPKASAGRKSKQAFQELVRDLMRVWEDRRLKPASRSSNRGSTLDFLKEVVKVAEPNATNHQIDNALKQVIAEREWLAFADPNF